MQELINYISWLDFSLSLMCPSNTYKLIVIVRNTIKIVLPGEIRMLDMISISTF